MVAAADKGKRSKVEDGVESSDPVDGELVLAIEKLQEVQDELEKVLIFCPLVCLHHPCASCFIVCCFNLGCW